MRLVAEIFDRLVIQQAVDRAGIGAIIHRVHPAPDLQPPFRHQHGEGDVGKDRPEGGNGIPEVEHPPEHAADQKDLE